MKLELPNIGYGTWQVDKRKVQALVQTAIESGYRHIDTANAYGNEKEIGEGIIASNKEDEVFVTSKIWPFDYKKNAYQAALKTIERMKLKKINLMLLHMPYKPEYNIKAYQDLMRLRKEGKIDHVGVANFNISELEDIKNATGEYPYINQIIFSPTTRAEEIEKFCKDKGIKLVGYSTLRSYFSPNPLFKSSGMSEEQKSYIDAIASKHKKDAGQVISKWALQSGYSIIPKSEKPSRIKSNILLEDFELSTKEMKTIDSWNMMDKIIFDKLIKKLSLLTKLSFMIKWVFKKKLNLL